ncbi:MAG: TldD/PmbA family protein, partial [Candidatus Bathyarchaeia archaeon]
MDLTKIIKYAEAEGVEQAEVFFFEGRVLRTIIENKQVKICEHKVDAGLGLRVALKKDAGYSLGFSYSTELSNAAIEQTIKQAVKVALSKNPDLDFKSFQPRSSPATVSGLHDSTILAISPENMTMLGQRLVEASASDKRIKTVRGAVGCGIGKTMIENSLGVSGEYDTTSFWVGVSVVAEEASSIGVGWDEYSSRSFNDRVIEEVALSAKEFSISQLHPKPIKGGIMDLIVAPSREGLPDLLLYAFIQGLRADNVQKQQSPLAGKLNQQIGSEGLTIVDDPHIPGALGSKPFDDEGCPTRKTLVIEKGVLTSFLHNTYTANKAGVSSTGNALRIAAFSAKPKYALEPLIGPTNTVIKSGSVSQERLIEEVKNGIITRG